MIPFLFVLVPLSARLMPWHMKDKSFFHIANLHTRRCAAINRPAVFHHYVLTRHTELPWQFHFFYGLATFITCTIAAPRALHNCCAYSFDCHDGSGCLLRAAMFSYRLHIVFFFCFHLIVFLVIPCRGNSFPPARPVWMLSSSVLAASVLQGGTSSAE